MPWPAWLAMIWKGEKRFLITVMSLLGKEIGAEFRRQDMQLKVVGGPLAQGETSL